MLQISYLSMLMVITAAWIAVRTAVSVKERKICWKREAQLLLVYICIVVVARFTCFPFEKVGGRIQPLVFDAARLFPIRINVVPFVYLMDYPERRAAWLNIMGNTAMFLPIGIVWPAVYKELNTHKKVIAAGAGFSLLIEILQLPFYDRVTDIDDLILNSLGFVIGYCLYVLVKKLGKDPGQKLDK